VVLGSAYLAKRDAVKAAEAYRKVVALTPKDPQGPYLVGLALRAQGKITEAKQEFEASLALAPGYLGPLAELAAIAIAERKPDEALARVQRQIALVPNSGELQFVLGDVYRVRRDLSRAETAYLKALELQPNQIGPYVRLGDLYAARGNYDQALAKVEGALQVNPKSLQALMLSGVIYGRKGDVAKAQAAYEKALAVEPRFAPAANNLAYLLAASGGDKDRSLQLAQLAKAVSPDDPGISDTLGWILYNRGVYQQAFTLLKESAAKLPDNPEVQYHLGMAALKVGDTETAKKSLAAATAASADFPGKDEARQALAQLR
jgi:tetratricopeptide (TPR) repeat protein